MAPRSVPLALVHHANQYLITDGYEGREGLSDLLERFSRLLDLHEALRIPLNLHLSGTLLEAIVWHRPEALRPVRRLWRRGLLELVGGAYGQNIMPRSSPELNRRQVRELLFLLQEHLRCPPEAVRVYWVPERVWDTRRLAPVLAEPSLPNGGYRAVLLDDRLLYPVGRSYRGSARARFDRAGPADVLPWPYQRPAVEHPVRWDPESARAYTIAGGQGLLVVPFPAGLRYAVPPSREGHWQYLAGLAEEAAREGGPETVLVYADDIEKSLGIGNWDPRGLAHYEAFLRWLKDRPELAPTLLSPWLAGRPAPPRRAVKAGTFFELARLWGAGEDYRGWWEGRRWRPYRRYFEVSEAAVRAAARSGAEPSLVELGWKQLLACSYEGGWHDVSSGAAEPAPWAKALASHARAALVVAQAARWHARRGPHARAELLDLDQDGEAEALLKHDRLFAVLSPARGGRLVYLFDLAGDGGRLVVGNPADDWNWQEELNRYMDRPPNHPGALADVGFEHDRYEARVRRSDGRTAVAELRNAQASSRLFGATKRVALLSAVPCLVVCYQLPPGLDGLSTECCLSPHYLRLLRLGGRGLRALTGACWRGWRAGGERVWVAVHPDERTHWAEPGQPRAGHALNLRVTASTPHFHLVIGTGRASERLVRRCVEALHSNG